YVAALAAPIRGLRVGVPRTHFFEGLHGEVDAAVRGALREMERPGAQVVDAELPDLTVAADVANVVARAEAVAVHVRLLTERPHELQPAVRARLQVGLRIPALDYLQALRLRARLTRRFIDEVFGTVDVLVVPSIP